MPLTVMPDSPCVLTNVSYVEIDVLVAAVLPAVTTTNRNVSPGFSPHDNGSMTTPACALDPKSTKVIAANTPGAVRQARSEWRDKATSPRRNRWGKHQCP
jgi:hypothetical protein